EDLRSAGAHEPREPDDLARVHGDVDTREDPGELETLDAEHLGRLRVRPGPRREGVLDVASGHELDDLRGRRRGDVQAGGHGAAVLEDGEAVPDLTDLVQ